MLLNTIIIPAIFLDVLHSNDPSAIISITAEEKLQLLDPDFRIGKQVELIHKASRLHACQQNARRYSARHGR